MALMWVAVEADLGVYLAVQRSAALIQFHNGSMAAMEPTILDNTRKRI